MYSVWSFYLDYDYRYKQCQLVKEYIVITECNKEKFIKICAKPSYMNNINKK